MTIKTKEYAHLSSYPSIYPIIYSFELNFCFRVLTTDQSFRKRAKNRRKESLETDDQAKSRYQADQEKIKSGKKKPHNHGNERYYDWDRQGCLREVRTYQDGAVINFAKLGKLYGLKNKKGQLAGNRGQLVKQFLVKNGIDLSRFQPARNWKNNTIKPRKAKKRYITYILCYIWEPFIWI